MIVEALLVLALDVAMWVLGLIPDWELPSLDFSQAVAVMLTFNAGLPVVEGFALISVTLALDAFIFLWDTFNWGKSHIPFIGGKG